jgi:LysM repeat protein
MMNDKFTNDLNEEDEKISQKLNQVAEQTTVNSHFAAELEEKLRSAHQPKAGWLAATFNQVSPVFRWVALMILLGLVLSWSIKSLIPAPQPSGESTPNGFVCPVTQPNGSLPPGTQPSETTNDPNLLGNGELWTHLRPSGKVYVFPEDQRTDGSFETNWTWYLGTDGQLTIEGHRLDTQSELLGFELAEAFNNLQSSTLIFPTTGCWEITGRVGTASLTFVTEVLLDAQAVAPTVVTTPSVVTNETTTPVAKEAGYDFRGAKLYLEAPLPDSPNKAHVYLLKKDEPASEEQARALADRFGIQGEMYTAPNYVFNTNDYLFSDGKQSLQVYSQRYFSYTADISKTIKISTNRPHENAEATIREFLQARGFNFQVSIVLSDSFEGYIVRPLAPDSIPIQYESYTYPAIHVTLDENGEVLSLDASLINYDTAPLGEYEISNAQEAFEKVLDDYAVIGKMEWVHSSGKMPQDWYRSYPDNQPVTIYGNITKYPAADPSRSALVLIDGVPVIGNIDGLESLDHYTFIKATGQYDIENDIRKFNVEAWDRNVQETSFSGTLGRQGDQIILTRDNGSGEQYALIDPPADVPLKTNAFDSFLEVYGVLEDGKLFWTFIRFFENYSSGGGGGGNGSGFYKLNLSGTPVAFPSPTAHPQINSEYITYVVQENDTLGSIASNFDVSIAELAQTNGLSSDGFISVGQELIIPNQQQATNNQPIGTYIVKEGDTLLAIAQNFGTTADELIRINNLTDSIIYVGQSLYVPMSEPTEQPVQDLRGILSIKIKNKGDGTSVKEYELEVPQDSGFGILTMGGSILSELDPYNALPILVTGTINTQGILVVDSYKIPYPDLQFQILKGTQRTEQIDEQNVVIFTTEDGKSYVEYMVTNNFPNTTSITGSPGDLIQQEVLIIPDETFGGLPVAHIYQSLIIQEGAPEMLVQANQIRTYNEPDDPMMAPNYAPPNLTIDHVELVYYVSNPYYQVNDPNYSQRSPYIEPAWHFQGRYDDGTEFDVIIQALKPEFLLPELAPRAGMG